MGRYPLIPRWDLKWSTDHQLRTELKFHAKQARCRAKQVCCGTIRVLSEAILGACTNLTQKIQAKLTHCERASSSAELAQKLHEKLILSQSFSLASTIFWLLAHLFATYL